MMKNITINRRATLCASAKPKIGLVRVGNVYFIHNNIGEFFTSDEEEIEIYISSIKRIISYEYESAIRFNRRRIDNILNTIRYNPIYPDRLIGDIWNIIKSMEGKPRKQVAIEICNKMGI